MWWLCYLDGNVTLNEEQIYRSRDSNQSCEQIVPLLCIPSFRAEGWLCMLAGFIWSAASLLLSRQDSSTILYSQPEDSLWKLNSYVLRFLWGYQGNRVKNCVSWKREIEPFEKRIACQSNLRLDDIYGGFELNLYLINFMFICRDTKIWEFWLILITKHHLYSKADNQYLDNNKHF